MSDENKPPEAPKEENTANQKFRCSECGKEFDKEASMIQHKNDAHSKKPESNSSGAKKKIPTAIIAIVGIVIVGAIGYFAFTSLSPSSGGSFSMMGALNSAHDHADIAIYVDGRQVTPLGPGYFVRDRYTHMEGGPGAGTVVHMHATNVALGYFLKSIGFSLDANCLEVATGKYCNTGDKTVKVYVKHQGGDWEQSTEYGNYLLRDLDKILITYGNDSPERIEQQKNSVTDFAAAN